MARKKATRKKAGKTRDLLISKSRVKAAVKNCNVGAAFYGALDEQVREAIAAAESRAIANGRKTLRPQDV